MANFDEQSGSSFDPVRRIETNDPVLGGANEILGVVNSPYNYLAQALVNRDIYLKEAIERLAASIPSSVQSATTSVEGIVRKATLTEMRAGNSDGPVATPRGVKEAIDNITFPDLTVPDATTAQKGKVELATRTEAAGRNRSDVVVTPYALDAALDAIPTTPTATTSRQGTVELATRGEGAARSRSDVAVTPDAMDAALDALPLSAILPAATPTITLSSNPGNIREQRNIVIGRMLFSRINIGGDVFANFTWTIGGGAWRIMSASYYRSSNRRLVSRSTGGDGTGILNNISHNSNNTQFRLDNSLELGDILLITAILN